MTFKYEVEIACFSCGVDELKKENGLEVAKVSEGNRIRTFDVVFNPTNYDTTCSCKLFYRQGIPCRHMIWFGKQKGLKPFLNSICYTDGLLWH